MEGENTFGKKIESITETGPEFGNEDAPNKEALEAKRDQYIREAIAELDKKWFGPKMDKDNINKLGLEVLELLSKKHGHDLDVLSAGIHGGEIAEEDQKDINKFMEITDTYPMSRIDELLVEYLDSK